MSDVGADLPPLQSNAKWRDWYGPCSKCGVFDNKPQWRLDGEAATPHLCETCQRFKAWLPELAAEVARLLRP